MIAGILNSTFGTMMMEFGGRYLENRDGTISNSTRVYELKDLWIINPEKINTKQRQKIVNVVKRLGKREILKIWEEFRQSDRQELDSIIFKEILGITQVELNDLYSSLSLIIRNRNTKKN